MDSKLHSGCTQVSGSAQAFWYVLVPNPNFPEVFGYAQACGFPTKALRRLSAFVTGAADGYLDSHPSRQKGITFYFFRQGGCYPPAAPASRGASPPRHPESRGASPPGPPEFWGAAPPRPLAILGTPPPDPRAIERGHGRGLTTKHMEAAAVADPSNGQSPAWPLEAATAADLAQLRRLRQQPTLRGGLGGCSPPAEAGRNTTLSSRVLIPEGSVSNLTVHLIT